MGSKYPVNFDDPSCVRTPTGTARASMTRRADASSSTSTKASQKGCQSETRPAQGALVERSWSAARAVHAPQLRRMASTPGRTDAVCQSSRVLNASWRSGTLRSGATTSGTGAGGRGCGGGGGGEAHPNRTTPAITNNIQTRNGMVNRLARFLGPVSQPCSHRPVSNWDHRMRHPA